MSHSELIDTTEMYLKTIFELEEEGIVPLRARIAERLHQSGPTVSQTVARMERDGLVTVEGDRHLELSPKGRQMATRVMRKHRLAERLLVDVIGLDWELAHIEACRWEHVISEEVERRLVEILGQPLISPYGNPIPGLDELGGKGPVEDFLDGVERLNRVVESLRGTDEEAKVLIRRIGEPVQVVPEPMEVLHRARALPGNVVIVAPTPAGALLTAVDATEGGGTAEISDDLASHIFVKRI
ncbi:metal-dependent transcriptional regulator [Actinopolymorpha sp. B17G11]|uniref:metal-dependent transcriptional regulator n=1 Tax=Actinopolymorpha sp. B17G11 TaxID=3160861 RepID=UPI0032E43977